jgi:hypothetical protein
MGAERSCPDRAPSRGHETSLQSSLEARRPAALIIWPIIWPDTEWPQRYHWVIGGLRQGGNPQSCLGKHSYTFILDAAEGWRKQTGIHEDPL